MTKIKVVKENKDGGFYIGRFKELKDMKPKPAVDKDGHDRAREKLINALKVEDVKEKKEATEGNLL